MANWLTDFVRPKIRAVLRRRDTPDNLWTKCPACGQMIFHRELKANLHVCHYCGHHLRIGPAERFEQLLDPGWSAVEVLPVVVDPLKFRDEKRYTDRLKEAKAKTHQDDAMSVVRGRIDELPVVVAVQNFAFMGGSMGLAVGEAMVAAARAAVADRAPLVVLTAAGGARMQEGTLSLMQMPRTTVAVQMVKEAGLPYIVVMTDPTTGGVTASFAMLGDVHISEPGALIGFAGARVIEQTIRERLPEGFQRAEYLLEHGMLDMVVPRRELKATLSRVLHLLLGRDPARLEAGRDADDFDIPAPAGPAATA
jgi:acetyl-CoA carboxylase carboxyl transferase subunit beta